MPSGSRGWRDELVPVPMTRVGIVAPVWTLRDALARVADAGVVELDRPEPATGSGEPGGEAARRLRHLRDTGSVTPAIAAEAPDLAALERTGRADLLAGEAELADWAAAAEVRGQVAGLVGWVPSSELPRLADRLAEVGAAAVPLRRPRGVDPPTAPPTGPARRTFAPLVDAYTVVPYRNLDPSVLAGLAYVVMFGAMFGDVGHGALLLGGALAVRFGRWRRLARLRPHWLFIAVAAVAAIGFGLAYGECFGPTGLVPVLWLRPTDDPVALLLAAVGFGAVLLAGAYALGFINRIREGGWARALYAPSGLAGSMLFVAGGVGVGAWFAGSTALLATAGALAAVGLGLSYAGLLAGSGGGAAGAAQAAIELVDLVVRLGANVVSFARLAAFGLTHAVLAAVVWDATTGLWHAGGAAAAAAPVMFLAGTAVAVGLEGLVAAVQALRLEYYELFSRVFQLSGRPYRPWHIRLVDGPSAGPGRSPVAGSHPEPSAIDKEGAGRWR